MNTYDCFNEHEIENIIDRFGTGFYEKVMRDVGVYAERWTLTSLRFIPSYSANLVFICRSEKYGNAVLKIGNASFGEIRTEIHTLLQYTGRRFCRVFETDIEHGVILEECVQPGAPLRNEDSLEKRLSVFCSLYKDLHVTPDKAGIYPTYTKWVDKITEYMSTRQDCTELYFYMKKARDICISVSNLYSQQLLLHGDFHHDNILLGPNGEYVLIDPKGVIGDPVFDVPRFIVNEFGNEKDEEAYERIYNIIRVLEKDLNIPNDVLRKLLYVETLMGVCWCVQDGEEYSSFINDVALAEEILNM